MPQRWFLDRAISDLTCNKIFKMAAIAFFIVEILNLGQPMIFLFIIYMQFHNMQDKT